MTFPYLRRVTFSALLLFGVLPLQSPVPAQSSQKCCKQCGEPCREYDITCCTVMVPKMVAVTCMESEVTYVKEEREEKYTAYKRVPVTREYYKTSCYLEQEIKSKEIIEEKCKLVEVPVTRKYKVKVPYDTVKDVTVTTPGVDKCGNPTCVDTIKTCNVVELREEERVEECCETQLVIETTQRTIDYCVMTPREKKERCAVDETFELQPVEMTRTVYACVPKLVKRPVTRMVCKMVPQECECCQSCAAKVKK